jgi:hypothetical protein
MASSSENDVNDCMRFLSLFLLLAAALFAMMAYLQVPANTFKVAMVSELSAPAKI